MLKSGKLLRIKIYNTGEKGLGVFVKNAVIAIGMRFLAVSKNNKKMKSRLSKTKKTREKRRKSKERNKI